MTLTAGQPAPPFTLPSSDGGTVALEDLRGTIVVLYFYPKDNTPGCTIQAEDFRDALPTLRALGATVLGVSKDSIASHCRFRDKFALTFPLLSDPDAAVMTAYEAWGEKMMYGKAITGTLRSTAMIDTDGTIIRHWPRVSAKGHADDVVAAVRAHLGGAAPSQPAASAAKGAKKPAAPAPAAAKKVVAPAKKAAPANKMATAAPAKKAAKAAPAKKAAKAAPAKKAAKPTPTKKAGKAAAKKPPPSPSKKLAGKAKARTRR